MAGSIWQRLRDRLGGKTRYASPRTEAGAPAVELLARLHAFEERDHGRFARLFLRGKPLAAAPEEQPSFDAFERAGLVRAVTAGLYRPCVRLFPLHGAMVATDLATHRDPDQVFELVLEQVYILKELGVREGDRALELCVGSGVNCVFLSDKAASVTAVDISPRALEFARFNTTLNPGGAPVELRLGSLCAPLGADERFDYVLVNPPFEPVPPGAQHFLHSHGGEDGLDVVRDLLRELPAHLAPAGRFEMFTWSPGDDERPVVADLLRDAFPAHRIEVHRVDQAPLDDRLATFRAEKGYDAWRQRLRDAGYTRIWGVFSRVDSEGPGETVVRDLPDQVDACRGIVSGW